MASDDETIDRLTDEELDELTSPDDNLDEADVEDSEHNVNIAAIICGIAAGILFIGAGIWLYCYLRDKHNECTLSRQIKQFKGDVKHITKEADPKRLARNAEVRHAMNTISDYVHDIPGHVQRRSAPRDEHHLRLCARHPGTCRGCRLARA